MKLLILGLLAIVLLASGSRRDCFWRWHTEARLRAMDARERTIEAREEARAHARQFREERREEMRAWRAAAREQRERIRAEIRKDIRDWRYTY
jgi:hypothetical protein